MAQTLTTKLKCPGTTGPKPYKLYTGSVLAQHPDLSRSNCARKCWIKYKNLPFQKKWKWIWKANQISQHEFKDPCDTEVKPTKRGKKVKSSGIKNYTETSNKHTDDSCKEVKSRKKEKKRRKIEEPEVEEKTNSQEQPPKRKKPKLTDSGEKSKKKKLKDDTKTRGKPTLAPKSCTATFEEPLIALPSSTESVVDESIVLKHKKKKRKDCSTSEDNVAITDSLKMDSKKKSSKRKLKDKAEKNAEKLIVNQQHQGETAYPENSLTESPELILTHVLKEQLKQAREELEQAQLEKINLAEKVVDLITKSQQIPDVRPASCESDVADMAGPLVSAKRHGQGSDSLPQRDPDSPASLYMPTSDSKTWFRPEVPSPLPSQVSAESSIQSKDTGVSLDSQSDSSILPTDNISGQSSAGEAILHVDSPTVGISTAQSSSTSSSQNSSGPSVLSWIPEDACSSFFGSLPSIQLLAQPCGLTSRGSGSETSLPYCLNFYYEIGHSSSCNRRIVVPPATPGYLLIPVGLRDSSLPAPGFVFTGFSSTSVNTLPVSGSAACLPGQVVSSSSASTSGHIVSSPLPAISQVSKPLIHGPRPSLLSPFTSPSFRRTSFPLQVIPALPSVSVPTEPFVSVPTGCNWSHLGAHKSIFQSALCRRRVETSVTFTTPPIDSPVHTASSVAAVPSSCEKALLPPGSPDPSLTLLSSSDPLEPSDTPSNITIDTPSDVITTFPDGASSEFSTLIVSSLPATSPGLDSSIASDLCQALTMTDSPGSKLSCPQDPHGEISPLQGHLPAILAPAILPPAEGQSQCSN